MKKKIAENSEVEDIKLQGPNIKDVLRIKRTEYKLSWRIKWLTELTHKWNSTKINLSRAAERLPGPWGKAPLEAQRTLWTFHWKSFGTIPNLNWEAPIIPKFLITLLNVFEKP